MSTASNTPAASANVRSTRVVSVDRFMEVAASIQHEVNASTPLDITADPLTSFRASPSGDTGNRP